jgi:hypothetical protein
MNDIIMWMALVFAVSAFILAFFAYCRTHPCLFGHTWGEWRYVTEGSCDQ